MPRCPYARPTCLRQRSHALFPLPESRQEVLQDGQPLQLQTGAAQHRQPAQRRRGAEPGTVAHRQQNKRRVCAANPGAQVGSRCGTGTISKDHRGIEQIMYSTCTSQPPPRAHTLMERRSARSSSCCSSSASMALAKEAPSRPSVSTCADRWLNSCAVSTMLHGGPGGAGRGAGDRAGLSAADKTLALRECAMRRRRGARQP